MAISDDQKRRIETIATALFQGLNEIADGDATESLAALYCAAQVMERELLSRGHLDLEQILHIHTQGRRVGAGMVVDIDEEVLDAEPEDNEVIN